MLDKSIPYKDIVMKADKEIAAHQPASVLPEGYCFHMYENGDEMGWAELETSVGEFEKIEDAIKYFQKEFIPYQDILKDRMCFILNKDKTIVSTATAWFDENENKRYSLLHWVSTSPNEQGKGLASAVVKYSLARFEELESKQDEIFLHTQTWSYPAIALYYKYGFRITHTPLPKSATDRSCIDILEGKLPKEILNNIIR